MANLQNICTVRHAIIHVPMTQNENRPLRDRHPFIVKKAVQPLNPESFIKFTITQRVYSSSPAGVKAGSLGKACGKKPVAV